MRVVDVPCSAVDRVLPGALVWFHRCSGGIYSSFAALQTPTASAQALLAAVYMGRNGGSLPRLLVVLQHLHVGDLVLHCALHMKARISMAFIMQLPT
jgi:hypothetical protein